MQDISSGSASRLAEWWRAIHKDMNTLEINNVTTPFAFEAMAVEIALQPLHPRVETLRYGPPKKMLRYNSAG